MTDLFRFNYILIKRKCSNTSMKIDFQSFWRVVSQVSQSVALHIYFGMYVSTVKRPLLFWQTRVRLQERCLHGYLSCLRIFHSFYSLAAKLLTRVLLSFLIILVLLPLLQVAVPFVVCLLIYYFWMSLRSWNEPMNSTHRHTQLSPQVEKLKSSLHQLRTASETPSTKSGKEQSKE